jgi:hypothetical protein
MGRFTVDQSRNGPFYFKGGGKMGRKLEAKIRKEIRRRALEQRDLFAFSLPSLSPTSDHPMFLIHFQSGKSLLKYVQMSCTIFL